MHVILNGEPLEEVDCFKYLGWQVAADGGCERNVVHRLNEYRAWKVLKSVLSNRGLMIKAKKCQYGGADQRVLRWFGHVERMDENSMARSVLMEEISVGRVRFRPRLGWMDRVKVALGNRGLTVEAARQCAKNRTE